MNEPSLERLEKEIKELAAVFEYPPTPDIVEGIHGRMPAPRAGTQPARKWAMAGSIVLLICLLAVTAVPTSRAALLKFLQMGAIQINLLDEPQPPPSAEQALSITDLGQVITMDEARALVDLRDPAYPAALGKPDAIYGQNLQYREPVISFLWHAAGERPQILLTQIEIPRFGLKWASGEQVVETAVAGQTAVWIEGPHLFDLTEAHIDASARTATNVLIWSTGDLTFRLEGDLSLDEAREIAESWQQ